MNGTSPVDFLLRGRTITIYKYVAKQELYVYLLQVSPVCNAAAVHVLVLPGVASTPHYPSYTCLSRTVVA